ncbi:hypothetical protein E2562_001046 [Oryza meyeriana var. granulata]|uniref:Uncharacterized protein n=1 Tax=Oryza meyeriana var. granulata TaxID=110450 RepID=A0A6G1ECX1_9ORYZ|nr:hypothetical protein E2562_001046 [Oryza meyeriana var. granulata]
MAVSTTTCSKMVTSSTTTAGVGSSTPVPALGSASAPPETVLDNTPASPRTAARVAPFQLGTACSAWLGWSILLWLFFFKEDSFFTFFFHCLGILNFFMWFGLHEI